MVAELLLAAAMFQRPAVPRAQTLVDAGIELSHRGRFVEAGAKVVEALSLDPAHSEAHYLLGLVRQQDGRPDAALRSFRAALRSDLGNSAARARVCEIETAAAIARESGYPAAANECRAAIQADPRDAEPRYHLGRNLAKLGDAAGAAREFAAALKLDPKLPGLRFEAGLAHADLKDWPRAIALFREVAAAEPSNGNARFQLGSLLVKQGDCAGAVPELEAAAESSQKYYLLAGCYKKAGRDADAAAAFAKVKDLREGADTRMQAKYRAAVARKHADAGRLADAEREFRVALELGPDSAIAVDLAVVLLRKGDAAGALALLANDASPLARYQTALALSKLGRQAEAVAVLEALTREKPDFAEAWYQLGVTRLSAGAVGEAESALSKACALRPDEPAMRLAWADALARSGRVAEAAEQRRIAARAPR